MDAMQLLLERASAVKLQEPGPSKEELETMLRCALRAPDHGRLRPWKFIVVEREQREQFGELMATTLQARDPDVKPETLARERQKAMRAPMILVVAAEIKPSEKIPEVEQIVSAGAAAEHIMLAAQAMGYGAMWRTGAPAYDENVKAGLGLRPQDAIIGVIYLGTPAMKPPQSPRPELGNFVAYWKG